LKILIYLQNCIGHRFIYASVFVDWASVKGYSTIVSSPDGKVTELERTNVLAVIPEGDNHLENIIALEKKFKPDLSLLANADFYIRGQEELLVYLDAPRRIIIVNYTLWVHDMEKSTSQNAGILNKINEFKAMVRLYIHRRKEKVYYCKRLPNMKIANFIASMDEYYVEIAKNSKVIYIPDIYTVCGVYKRNEIQEKLKMVYNEFKKSKSSYEVILYLGAWQERRGLLDLLKFTARTTNRLFVCVGDKVKGRHYCPEIEVIYTKLLNEGRIFMTNTEYVDNGIFMDEVFNSIDVVILPYKHFHGGSGSVITAASFGKPVLVPNYGHMNKTVKKYGIGRSYIAGDLNSLDTEYKILLKSNIDYELICKKYAALFTKEKVYNSLDKAIVKCFE